MQDYALYKGDELLALGTLDEMEKQLGVRRKSILRYGTPSYRKKCKGRNGKVLIKLED